MNDHVRRRKIIANNLNHANDRIQELIAQRQAAKAKLDAMPNGYPLLGRLVIRVIIWLAKWDYRPALWPKLFAAEIEQISSEMKDVGLNVGEALREIRDGR